MSLRVRSPKIEEDENEEETQNEYRGISFQELVKDIGLLINGLFLTLSADGMIS